jgi:hypothetical protein
LDILSKVFVTRGRPIKVGGFNVYLRDTTLLAPAGKQSLEAIGSLYAEKYNKVKMAPSEIENMDRVLIENPEKFKEYALNDAVIPLIHSAYMEDYNFKIGVPSIPLTISNLAVNRLKDF